MIRFRAVNGLIWLILAVALHVWPGMIKPVHGQGTRKDDIVFNSRGVPLGGATIRVCAMPASGKPCTPVAQIYSDAGLTQALANPTTTDGMGNYFFYAAPGQYELEISGPGITTKQIPNVILPSDPSAPTFNSLSTTGGISAFTLNLSGNLTVNGSTSVVGNLASGTLTLNNQGTAPGAASAGTVNLYTKSTDKRLYYKDETGTEVGPLTMASGAQTNVANNWTAAQNIDADFHTKGPNPNWDVMRFGGYIGANYSTPTTGSISSGSATLNIASALDFANGQGVLVLNAGPAPVIATPQAPTVTPIAQVGSTSYSYCVVDEDWYGGRTPCSAVGSTSTGMASFGLQSYTVSGWSATNGVVTITTSTPHNIPTSRYSNGQFYPQINITASSSGFCNGAWTAVNVPSATTVQITRYGVPDSTMNGCSGGTLQVLPRVILKWDSRYSFSISNASCSGSTASLTISPSIYGPNGQWVVPFYVKAIVAGVSDSHYNGTVTIGGWATGNGPISYPIGGGTCSGVNTGNLGGTLAMVPGKAAKNHLIYRCAGASCALPANAGNYALVGVATGVDGYFTDNGTSPSVSATELGDIPSTPPAAASNDYLSTTIASGGGTTSLTLAANATNSVAGVKVFHDNTPNLLAVCAALPNSGTKANGGHIVIPAFTSVTTQGYSLFPIMANFDTVGNFATGTQNCPGGTTFDFRSNVWMQGTIMLGKNINMISDSGAAGCAASGMPLGNALACFSGFAYPMLYFEPEQGSYNHFENLVFTPNQPYESAIYIDQQLNGDGTTGERFDNVHVNGNPGSLPIVDKGGFGRYWNFGGWSAVGGNFATQRTYIFTQNCMPIFSVNSSALGAYITEFHNTYNYGTGMVDGCGQSVGAFGTAVFSRMLSESVYGPIWLFNTLPYQIQNVTFDHLVDADRTGGQATPLIDLGNSAAIGVHFKDQNCSSNYQTLIEGNPTFTFAGVDIADVGGCYYTGSPNYHLDSLSANLSVEDNYNRELLGTAQIYTPMASPSNFQSVTQLGAGNVPVGTHVFCLTASDALGGETALNYPGLSGATCTSVTITGQASIVQLVMPAAFPGGATGLNAYIDGGLVNASTTGCAKPQYTTPGGTYTHNTSTNCNTSPPWTTGTAIATGITPAAVATPKLLLNGEFTGSVPRSEQNIFLPGALTSTWTASSWTPDKAVTVSRLQVQAKTAPAGCSTNAVVRLTDGSTPVNLTISGAANDSGSISQNYAAGSTITVSVQTAAAGCTTSPADANVTVQYRMQ